MFLKEIETRPAEGMTKVAFKKLRDDGEAIPEILHLFRFKRGSTDHLVRFTEAVMRGPSPLSPGLRDTFQKEINVLFAVMPTRRRRRSIWRKVLSMKFSAIWRLHGWMRRTKRCFVTSANWRNTRSASRLQISTNSKKRAGVKKRFMTR